MAESNCWWLVDWLEIQKEACYCVYCGNDQAFNQSTIVWKLLLEYVNYNYIKHFI